MFNAALSLVSFAIEIVLAALFLARKRSSRTNQLGALLLLVLALYQLSEFFICIEIAPLFFAKFGHFLNALLPAIGLHLAVVMCNRKMKWAMYLPVVIFAGLLFTDQVVVGAICREWFIEYIYGSAEAMWGYAIYYFLYLITILLMFIKQYQNSPKITYLLALASVIVFLVPTFFLLLFYPDATRVFSSILCHVALLVGIALFVFVKHSKK